MVAGRVLWDVSAQAFVGIVEAATPRPVQRERDRGTAPQLAQSKSTSSAGGLVMGHWTPLMMKGPEPLLRQANSFATITSSPETYMPAGYHMPYT
jgi:hypothetical protein